MLDLALRSPFPCEFPDTESALMTDVPRVYCDFCRLFRRVDGAPMAENCLNWVQGVAL